MDQSLDFPFPVFTPVCTATTRPTHRSLITTGLELNANATSIATLIGDGVTGHLFLMLTPLAYFTLNAMNFTPPVNPGPAPIQPLNPGTAAEIAEIFRLHKQASTIFQLYNRVDNALRNQLIKATPDVYIRHLRDPITGYGSVTALQMLTHLKTTYS